MGILQRILGPLLGITFGLTIWLTSFFGSYIITLIIPALFLNKHHFWRSFMDRAISFWIIIPVTLLEYVFGVKSKLIGDTIDYDRPAVIIMNHRTRLDWMYLWIALFKINPWLLLSLKIALKAELQRIPAAGFGMAANHFIFLKRKIDTDKGRISEAINYYASIGNIYQVLFFPEGTDKTTYTTRRSNEYAKKNGLRELKNVIYPRSAGFVHLINEMRRNEYIDYIYDVTIAYPENIVQSESELIFTGQAPKKVLFFIERIDIAYVPRGDQEVTDWINKLWIEKDEKLERFYAQQPPYDYLPDNDNKFVWEEKDEPLHKMAKIISCFTWFTVIPIWLFHLTFLPLVQALFIYFIVVQIYTQYVYGGIEEMVYTKWWRKMKVKVPKKYSV